MLNGSDADVLMVHASDGNRPRLLLVVRGAPGLAVTEDCGVDRATSTATVRFHDTPAVVMSGAAEHVLDLALDRINLAVAAWQSGAVTACLAMMTDYAKHRYCFGNPIGAYQAIKHAIAELYGAHALADAQLRVATEAADHGDPGASAAATTARLLFDRLYYDAATRNQFVHGGLGYTWEHESHLYTKNAIAMQALLGDEEYQRGRLADQLGL